MLLYGSTTSDEAQGDNSFIMTKEHFEVLMKKLDKLVILDKIREEASGLHVSFYYHAQLLAEQKGLVEKQQKDIVALSDTYWT